MTTIYVNGVPTKREELKNKEIRIEKVIKMFEEKLTIDAKERTILRNNPAIRKEW